MSFFHAPTALSLAIGAGLTLVDLCLSQHFASRRMLEEFEAVRRPTGGTVLEALQSAGLVEVRRDASGQIDRIVQRVRLTTILDTILELARQDVNMRQTLTAHLN
jgi:predicted transcriptional regulator